MKKAFSHTKVAVKLRKSPYAEVGSFISKLTQYMIMKGPNLNVYVSI